jgi:hypothetical protein
MVLAEPLAGLAIFVGSLSVAEVVVDTKSVFILSASVVVLLVMVYGESRSELGKWWFARAVASGNWRAAALWMEEARDRSTDGQVPRELLDEGLRTAAAAGRMDSVRQFLAEGASPKALGLNGMSALDASLMGRHLPVAQILVAGGTRITSSVETSLGPELLLTARLGSVDHLRLLIDAGMTVRLDEALVEAAANGRLEAAKLLLSVGANPHRADSRGRTAVTAAREEGHTELLEMLESPLGSESTP